MKVRDPQGQTWRVTRRWVPWRPRRRYLGPRLWVESAGSITEFVFALVFGLVIFPILTFVFLSGGEIVLLGLIVPFVAIGRIAFGKHWWIEAREGFTPFWEEQAGTWRLSGERIRKVAGDIERGDLPLQSLGTEPSTEVI
ncbi:hypothetical protein [Nocardioides sp. WS12]|uniref:hypothetical protein n=1 Tax=Nocardioides sp. WS12 TaxID=2486272 RepID=UPI0015FBF3EA|nr:hypothetical protein [Nocardioides sp. WS12]